MELDGIMYLNKRHVRTLRCNDM